MPGNNSIHTDNTSLESEAGDNLLISSHPVNASMATSAEIPDEMGGPCIDEWLSRIRMDEKYHSIVEMYEQLIIVYNLCKQDNQRWAMAYQLLEEINEGLEEKNRGLVETNQLLADGEMIFCDEDQAIEDDMNALGIKYETSNRHDDGASTSSLEYEIEELTTENFRLSAELEKSECYNREYQQIYLNLLQINAYLMSKVGFLEHTHQEQTEASAVLEQRVRELSTENELLNDCYQEDVVNYRVASQANEGLFAIILQQQQEIEMLKESLKKYEAAETGLQRANLSGLFSV